MLTYILIPDLFKDITGLNKQISNLQQVGQEKANQSVSNEKQGQDHSKLVVVGLQSKLATVSKAFQSALELRTEVLIFFYLEVCLSKIE